MGGALWGGNLVLLGRLLASFALSWGVLERLLCPSWPKLAQDSEKSRFFEFDLQIGDPSWDPNLKKIDVKNYVFFKRVFDIDFYRYFSDSLSILDLKFGCFLNC